VKVKSIGIKSRQHNPKQVHKRMTIAREARPINIFRLRLFFRDNKIKNGTAKPKTASKRAGICQPLFRRPHTR
jgi:hypothetical protein